RGADGARRGVEALRDLAHHGGRVRAIGGEGIVAAGHPFALAMPALVDGDGAHAGVGDAPRRHVPGAAGLAAAMEQQNGTAVTVPQIGGEPVAVSPGEGDRLRRHEMGWSSRKASTFAFQLLSPTESMWSRPS